MAASKPRNRIVVFRLTQDEYNSLKEFCQAKGGRNLSDFTRSELLMRLNSDPICDVSKKLEQLQVSLHRISQLLEGKSVA